MSEAKGAPATAGGPIENGAGRGFLQRWRWPLIIGGPLVIIAIAIYFVLTGGHYESTDDSYVDIAKAPVSASIAGRVVEVYVKENQRVAAGAPLFRLDPRDLKAGLDQAQAQVAQAELQVRALQAAYQEATANQEAAQNTAAYTAREATRQKALVAAGVNSQAQLDEAVHAAQQAADSVIAAKTQVAQALANLNGDPSLSPAHHPQILNAQAQLERARLNTSYGVIVAPVDGVVTRVEQLQPGAYVNAAQTVFWLISGQPWVEANFKESQLAHMKVGQPVEIDVDAYPGEKLQGHVSSFSPGTGQAFSALPAQNATGNWVKVTQRLPVRIEFNKPPPAMAGRAGLSAKVKVDVRAPGQATGAAG